MGIKKDLLHLFQNIFVINGNAINEFNPFVLKTTFDNGGVQ